MKKGLLILVVAMLWGADAFSIVRFKKDQLKFNLSEMGAGKTECTHEALETGSEAEPPPWWTVRCGDRTYTVDIWMDFFVSKDRYYNFYLLYHVKESVSSSGEKLTRFDTQTTKMKLKEPSSLGGVSSSVDVRNGLADLNVDVDLKQGLQDN